MFTDKSILFSTKNIRYLNFCVVTFRQSQCPVKVRERISMWFNTDKNVRHDFQETGETQCVLACEVSQLPQSAQQKC